MRILEDDRLECWNPAGDRSNDALEAERAGAGLCGEAQADGVPCLDVKRLCEVCGRAHGVRPAARQRAISGGAVGPAS